MESMECLSNSQEAMAIVKWHHFESPKFGWSNRHMFSPILLHCSLVADKIQVVPEERDAEESAEKENVIEAGLAVFCD